MTPWNSKKTTTLFWESLFAILIKKGSDFLLKQMVKNLQSIKNSFLLLLKWQIVLTFKVKKIPWFFYKESHTIKNSVIYNDLVIQNIFFLLYFRTMGFELLFECGIFQALRLFSYIIVNYCWIAWNPILLFKVRQNI